MKRFDSGVWGVLARVVCVCVLSGVVACGDGAGDPEPSPSGFVEPGANNSSANNSSNGTNGATSGGGTSDVGDVGTEEDAGESDLDTSDDARQPPTDAHTEDARDTNDAEADAPPSDANDPDAPVDGEGWPFRVWAPNAQAASVVWWQDGDDTQREAALEASGEGWWEARVPEVGAGDLYRFRLVTASGGVVERVDPWAFELDRGASVAREPLDGDDGFAPPPLSEAVIYELHVGTYHDAPGGAPGTFEAAIERLDHLAAMGVNVIELMPIWEFPGEYSWGYNPQLPFVVESSYGGGDGLRAFVEAAHALGIAVTLDVVYNHLNGDNPMCDFDIDAGEGCGGPYFYGDAERRQTDWGPRPDFGSAQVRGWLWDNVRLWYEGYGVDGMRWDSTSNIWSTEHGRGVALPEGEAWLAEVNVALEAEGWGGLSMAEDFNGGARLTRPVASGGMGFDAQWDGGFHWVMRELVLAREDGERDVEAVRSVLTGDGGNDGDPLRRVIFTESHDTAGKLNTFHRQPHHTRLPREIDEGDPGSWRALKLSTLAASVLMTAPGVPMLLQGQEFATPDAFHDDAPVDWALAEERAGIVELYTHLIGLRRNLQGHSRGLTGAGVEARHINTDVQVLILRRFDQGGPGDDVMVVINASGITFDQGYRFGLPAEGRWWVRFNSDAARYHPSFSDVGGVALDTDPVPYDGYAYSGELELGPYSVLILSQDPAP